MTSKNNSDKGGQCSGNPGERNNTVIESWLSGSLSSAFTTVIYQPLELLKTRMQLHEKQYFNDDMKQKLLGRATQSATKLARDHGLGYLWRGTGASLLRSVPGVGLYYASLNVLQSHLSEHGHKPDNPTQAFYFGITARSLVSFLMLPVTVVKVRYESGRFSYPSLSAAIICAYRGKGGGWVGVTPTILRDSLFSGIYLMCYTKLKTSDILRENISSMTSKNGPFTVDKHLLTFVSGIISGLIASILTNPIDVVKTNIQVETNEVKSMKHIALKMIADKGGYLRFFDGLVPRSLRRTLIAASTWTFYEFLMDSLR